MKCPRCGADMHENWGVLICEGCGDDANECSCGPNEHVSKYQDE